MTLRQNKTAKSILAIAVLGVAVAFVLTLRRPPAPLPPAAAPLPTVLRRDLVQRDGHWYQTGQTNLFHGWMTDTYPDGARLSRSEISNGLPNGVSEVWYTNGQMQVRETFKDGISDGPREKWYENGQKLSQATIVDGKVTGTFQSWHDNGQLAEQIEMKLGQPDGTAWAYYPSGFVKTETTARDGKILTQKTWKDGDHKAAP